MRADLSSVVLGVVLCSLTLRLSVIYSNSFTMKMYSLTIFTIYQLQKIGSARVGPCPVTFHNSVLETCGRIMRRGPMVSALGFIALKRLLPSVAANCEPWCREPCTELNGDVCSLCQAMNPSRTFAEIQIDFHTAGARRVRGLLGKPLSMQAQRRCRIWRMVGGGCNIDCKPLARWTLRQGRSIGTPACQPCFI